MSKADVLDRVAADIAGGRTYPALQRLASLVAVHPTDLDLRHRLAALYRMVGNTVQAGRWGYLNADADPAEIAAFERAYPSPVRRMSLVRWPTTDRHPATDYARARLAALTELVNREQAARTPDRAGIPASMTPSRWVLGGIVGIGIALAALALLGGITIVQWLVG
jgi:hypothetical protein